MRMLSKGKAGAIAAGAIVVCLASVAWANVYPSGVTIDSANFNNATGTASISYYLNENADGDGTNPGVKIEVLDATNTAVRTVTIAHLAKGKHWFEWDGRADDGSRAPNGSYTVKITAADFGYTAWTQTSTDNSAVSFYTPVGVSVNKNPTSPYYGTAYVSNATTGTTANATYGRANPEGIYRLNPDLTEAGSGTAGITWGGTLGPWKSSVGEDDRLYVSDLSLDLAFEIMPDLSSAAALITAANRSANQYVGGIFVTGTQAAGNRKIYLSNTNYNDTARKGLIMYNLGAAAMATGTGTQIIGPGYFAYYPNDFSLDAEGNYYTCQYRYTPAQAPPISKFANGTPPINTAVWEADSNYTGAYGIDVDSPRGRVAYADYYTGYVRVFDTATGAFLGQFDSGSRGREVAFDAAGNIYVVDNTVEWLRVWSPPDGPNSMNVTTQAIALNKTGSGGPVITVQPADVAICPGENASFSVTATGGTLSYQWKKNGTILAGETNSTLNLTAVPASEDGSVYTCVVSDANGIAVSNPALLTVGISFLQAPLNTRVCQNSNAIFTVSVANPGATYQWQRTASGGTDYTDIAGATDATLTLPVTAADNNSRVRCVVTAGACGSANSPSALLTVSTGPLLGNVALSYGTPAPRPAGSGATFYAIVVNSTGPLTWQWNRAGTPLTDGAYPWGVVSGANTPNLVLTELTCAANGSFTVSVTDACGTTTSNCTANPGTTGQTCYLTVGLGTETCNNGVDDDCDTFVDCQDSDCNADPFCGPSCHTPFADWDEDGDVDMLDFADFQRCYSAGAATFEAACECFDYNNDGVINEDDATKFIACGSGPGNPADPACDDRPAGLGKVVINEVAYDMVDPAGVEITDQFEFVELYNRSNETVDISGWILKASDVATDDNRDFVVPGGVGSGTTLLAPGGYFVFTSPNAPVGVANPPYLNYVIVPSPTDIWENGPDALELLDANKNPADTVIYNRNVAGTVAAAGEGSIWGAYVTVDGAAQQSISRWFDGWDTNSNGRDFGLRPWTPGANNQGTAQVVSTFALGAIDGMNPGATITSLDPAFQPAIVIDPTVNTTSVAFGTSNYVVNPSVIPASPQGGKAAVVWDFASGGGTMVASRALMNNAGAFDLYVYLDTSFTAWAANTGSESTSYGVMGTTNTVYNAASPDGAVLTTTDAACGNTGLFWVFNKVKGTTSTCKLFLVDAGPGGARSTWTTQATIDMTAQPSGWYRLSISYNGTTGAVTANGPGGPYNFTAATGLAGQFYVGYRESTPAAPATAGSDISYLRPATFDSAQ